MLFGRYEATAGTMGQFVGFIIFIHSGMESWYDIIRSLKILLPMAEIGNAGCSLPKLNSGTNFGCAAADCSSI